MDTTHSAIEHGDDPISPTVQKLVALAGIAFALLMIASIILSGDSAPDFDDPVGDWSTWATDNQDNVRLGALVFAFATYEFILFLAALRSALGRAEEAARGFTRGGYAVLIGGTIGVTGILIGLTLAAAAASHPDASPDVIRAISDASTAGFVVAAPGFAAMLITTFLIAKPTRALPSWLCWVALLTGIFFLLQLLTLLSEEGDNAFGVFYPLAFLGLVIFAVGASLVLFKRLSGGAEGPTAGSPGTPRAT